MKIIKLLWNLNKNVVNIPVHTILPSTAEPLLLQSKRNASTWKAPKTPELIYVPHILKWLKTKLKFKYLQKTWDPDFSEGAFIYGSTTAICRITELIHENKLNELKDLIASSVYLKLLDDINRLTPVQKKIIRLKPQDIKILIPQAVVMKTNGIEKRCSINLRTLALKWHGTTGTLRLVLVALQSEFERDYTEGADAEWTITNYDILECAMLNEASTSQ